jgi:hypothetical protein
MACVEVAVALGYLNAPVQLLGSLSEVVGTLVVLVRAKQQ